MENSIIQTDNGYIELLVEPPGSWKKTEYVNGKVVYIESSYGGAQEWVGYDEIGNQISYKKRHSLCMQDDFNAMQYAFAKTTGDYLTKPETCYCNRCGNYWEKFEYDGNNNCVYWENSEGSLEKNEYDMTGNHLYWEMTFQENRKYETIWEKFEYDVNGNCIYSLDWQGGWEKFEFDENGNEVSYENSEGYWKKREFDENGNEVSFKASGPL